MDKTLRQLERNQNSLQYKLGFGEVLPTESSPKIFNDTQLLVDIRSGLAKGCGWGFGDGTGDRSGSRIGIGHGIGSGFSWGSGYGSGRR